MENIAQKFNIIEEFYNQVNYRPIICVRMFYKMIIKYYI